jgi:hypothetical protein
MINKFSYKIIFLFLLVCIVLAIPIMYDGYEGFNTKLVANRIPNSFGYLASLPP